MPDVVGDHGLEEGTCLLGYVQHQRARDFDLAHAELPPVASQPIGAREWAGNASDPVIEEGLQLGRAQPIAHCLQPGWRFAGGEAVGQFGEHEAVGGGLTLGPLVAVDPHLQRVREIAADLDEAEPERRVEDVEVVHRHSAVGFVEAELRRAGLAPSRVAHEDLLDLLGDNDDHDSGLRGVVDVFADVIDLAVIPARAIRRIQMQHRDAIGFCK